MSLVLFVGDSPSSRMKADARPFEGAACQPRLNNWIDLLEVGSYVIMNQSETMFFSYVLRAAHSSIPIVALGNVASKRLKRLGIKHFKLPHPSGRNRQINDKTFVNIRLAACKEFIKD